MLPADVIQIVYQVNFSSFREKSDVVDEISQGFFFYAVLECPWILYISGVI